MYLEQVAYQSYPWRNIQGFIYNFGLRVLGLAVSHINESICKLMSPEHYF